MLSFFGGAAAALPCHASDRMKRAKTSSALSGITAPSKPSGDFTFGPNLWAKILRKIARPRRDAKGPITGRFKHVALSGLLAASGCLSLYFIVRTQPRMVAVSSRFTRPHTFSTFVILRPPFAMLAIFSLALVVAEQKECKERHIIMTTLSRVCLK